MLVATSQEKAVHFIHEDSKKTREPIVGRETGPEVQVTMEDRKTHESMFVMFDKHRLVGLVVKTSAWRAEDPGFESRLRRDFSWSSHTSGLKIGTPVVPCQAPGDMGSALGLVGPVSVYCDWVRWKVGSAASTSVWQHVQLSEQIRP